MRLLTPKVLLAGGVTLALLASVGGYLVADEFGLLVGLVVTQLLAITMGALIWRESDRAEARRLGQLERSLLREQRNLSAVDRRQRSEGDARLLERLEEHRAVTEGLSHRVDRVAALVEREGERAEALERGLREQYWQLEALAGLYARLRPSDALPATRGWAASPDLLLHLAGLARRTRPSLVLECGSGVSTLVLASEAARRGAGRVIALEHLDEYRQATEQLLAEQGLSEWAEVRYAPIKLVELDGQQWPWYDVEAVPDGPLDLIFVDGPPEATGPRARWPAGPLLLPQLVPGGWLVLDDHRRPDEQACVEAWQQAYPELELVALPHEKGTAALHRPH